MFWEKYLVDCLWFFSICVWEAIVVLFVVRVFLFLKVFKFLVGKKLK